MQTLPLPEGTPGTSEKQAHGLFEGDLADLYAAILIVVPAALFLKYLWP